MEKKYTVHNNRAIYQHIPKGMRNFRASVIQQLLNFWFFFEVESTK